MNITHRHRDPRVLCKALCGAAALMFLLTCAPAGAGEADMPPEGLTTADWSAITGQLQARRYRAHGNDSGYRADNPAHGFSVAFGRNGETVLRPRADAPGDYRLAMRLASVGFGEAERLTRPQAVEAKANTVTYRWSETLREWWVNDDTGVEQGFELTDRPAGQEAGEPLRLSLALATDLAVEENDRGIAFRHADRSTTITYDKPRVRDAEGRALPVRLVLAGGRLHIVIDDAGAVFPVTVGPVFTQQAYLKASNTNGGDVLGYSVSVSGDTVVVGAPAEDSAATGVNGDESDNSARFAGAAYVFVRDGSGAWTQQAYLKASNTDAGDQFGGSVSVSGDTVVVGAAREDSAALGVDGDEMDDSANDSGAAYVFVRDGSGTWTQQAYLKASNTDEVDEFGLSVSVSGNTLLVGAPFEDSAATGVDGDQTDNLWDDSGAAYVFVRDGAGAWTQQAYLKASNSDELDEFGTSVSVSGDSVVVGAPREDSVATGVDGDAMDNSTSASGAAYVFVRDGSGTWTQQAYLKASNTDELDQFGLSVSVSGDTAVVGARLEDSAATGVDGDESDKSAGFAGAAYVFVRDGAGTWTQQAYLKASNTDAGDWFGTSVSVSGDTVVVGAMLEDSAATGADGDEDDNSATNSGAAYVFARDGAGTWTQQAYLKASNTDEEDDFGGSVSVSGDTMVVGATAEDSAATGVDGDDTDNSLRGAGAAYVFFLNDALADRIFADGFESMVPD